MMNYNFPLKIHQSPANMGPVYLLFQIFSKCRIDRIDRIEWFFSKCQIGRIDRIDPLDPLDLLDPIDPIDPTLRKFSVDFQNNYDLRIIPMIPPRLELGTISM